MLKAYERIESGMASDPEWDPPQYDAFAFDDAPVEEDDAESPGTADEGSSRAVS